MSDLLDLARDLIRPLAWTLLTISAGVLLGWLCAVGAHALIRRESVSARIGTLVNGVPAIVWGALLACALGGAFAALRMGGRRGTYDTTLTPGLDAAFIESALAYAALPIVVYATATFGRSLRVHETGLRGNAAALARAFAALIGWCSVVEPLFNYDGVGMALYWAVNQGAWLTVFGALAVMIGVGVFALGLARYAPTARAHRDAASDEKLTLWARARRTSPLPIRTGLTIIVSALILGWLPIGGAALWFARLRGALFHPDAARALFVPLVLIALVCVGMVLFARNSERDKA